VAQRRFFALVSDLKTLIVLIERLPLIHYPDEWAADEHHWSVGPGYFAVEGQ